MSSMLSVFARAHGGKRTKEKALSCPRQTIPVEVPLALEAPKAREDWAPPTDTESGPTPPHEPVLKTTPEPTVRATSESAPAPTASGKRVHQDEDDVPPLQRQRRATAPQASSEGTSSASVKGQVPSRPGKEIRLT
ncbi:hypothetical protein ACS0TY_018319 [Phlomoides rotata]